MCFSGFHLGFSPAKVKAMLSQLTGTILEIAPDHVVLDCHGVGYQVFCPGRCLGGLESGKAARLYTVLNVREDALTLYGFPDRYERQMFQLLTGTVSGVGPRIGLALLSSFATADIVSAILANQPGQLSRAPGVGKKLAEKIIVELKDKLKSYDAAPGAPAAATANQTGRDIASALINLGYQPKTAEAAAEAALKDSPDAGFDVLFRLALRKAA